MHNLNLKEQFSNVHEYFSPKVIGRVNNEFVKLVKIQGDRVPWHYHEESDELFYIIEGSLKMEVNRSNFIMNPGDLFIVKKGINHRVSSTGECLIMLIEHETTLHTGNIVSEITKTIYEQQ